MAFSTVGLAACGGDDDDSSSSSSESAATTESTTEESTESSSSTSEAEAAQVSIKDIQFQPQDLTVDVGQKIVWTNNDSVDHTVTATDGADFDSGVIKPGETFEFTPEQAGTIEYECTIHAGQTGTIEVKE